MCLSLVYQHFFFIQNSVIFGRQKYSFAYLVTKMLWFSLQENEQMILNWNHVVVFFYLTDSKASQQQVDDKIQAFLDSHEQFQSTRTIIDANSDLFTRTMQIALKDSVLVSKNYFHCALLKHSGSRWLQKGVLQSDLIISTSFWYV